MVMGYLVRLVCLVGVAACAVAAGGAVLGSSARAASGAGQSLCIAHHPQEYVWYTQSCTGHDEPEIDPLSTAPGSAQDLTWTVVLPTDEAGTAAGQVGQVDSVGPTFWIGGAVTDPNSLDNQAFLELQFYPNSITTNCTAGGGYNVTYSANTYTACSPVWEVSQDRPSESAAFNAMLTRRKDRRAAGHARGRHDHRPPVRDGGEGRHAHHRHGHDHGPLGHDRPEQQDRWAADARLQRPEAGQRARLGTGERRAERARLGDRPHRQLHDSRRQVLHTGQRHQAALLLLQRPDLAPVQAAADQGRHLRRRQQRELVGDRLGHGGKAEVLGNSFVGPTSCSGYGGPFCTYPWYAWNGKLKAFTYGGDYPGTTKDFGQADQFQQTENCASPADGSPQYCATILR